MNEEFEKKLRQYAELVVKTALNLQRDQLLLIRGPIECAHFVHLVAEEAYKAGARDVVADWLDDQLDRLHYLHARDDMFDLCYDKDRDAFDLGMNEDAVTLFLFVQDPKLYEGVDPQRTIRARRARNLAYAAANQLQSEGRARLCAISPPTPAWARAVYPELGEEAAMEALWEDVFAALRIDGESDPAENWRARFTQMQRTAEKLNALDIRSLHYTNRLGTDFTVSLHPEHRWMCTYRPMKDGRPFVSNFPSEEIFTIPEKSSAEGVVYSSIPLIYRGNTIKDMRLEFKGGKVVRAETSVGEETLRTLLSIDEGASYLGEVALVPNDSGIRSTGKCFLNGLYDENASCHLALGLGIGFCIRGGENMSREELEARGVNFAGIHIDFMIGTDDLQITALTADGREVPVFTDGNFAPELTA